jgi:hypothetical protein
MMPVFRTIVNKATGRYGQMVNAKFKYETKLSKTWWEVGIH